MSIAAVVLGAIFLAGALFISLAPLFQEDESAAAPQRDLALQVHNLRTRLNRLLESIHDLDFDYDTGKITPEVYAQQRKLLIGRGVSLLIQLDKAETELQALDEAIEAAVAQRRTIPTPEQPATDPLDDDIEAAIAARREAAQ